MDRFPDVGTGFISVRRFVFVLKPLTGEFRHFSRIYISLRGVDTASVN